MQIVVTGKSGQIATSMSERAAARGHRVIRLGRPELDLARPSTVRAAFASCRADVIVSAAAYTAVDQAESERDLAVSINVDGARAVAEAAESLGIPLIHFSTDFVFDGSRAEPYTESDATGPLNVYGQSKLAGERAVLAAHADSVVLRTAWVYSPFGNNFLKSMLRLAADRDEIGVVADQFGNPTSALTIADAAMAVAERLVEDNAAGLRGVFHMSAAGAASWADFAEAIFEVSSQAGGAAARIRRIPASEYPAPARRPESSRLDCNKLASLYDIRLGDWREAVDEVVRRSVSQSIEGKQAT